MKNIIDKKNEKGNVKKSFETKVHETNKQVSKRSNKKTDIQRRILLVSSVLSESTKSYNRHYPDIHTYLTQNYIIAIEQYPLDLWLDRLARRPA